MSFMWSLVAVSVGSSVATGIAGNNAAEAGQKNANRRYAMKGKNAENQMDEQKSLAFEKMTEVTRGFLKTKGTMQAVEAETMVTGNVAKRLKGAARRESSEAKGQVAKVANANIKNIAQDMLAEKIDTEAVLSELESRKKSSLQIAIDAGVAGVGTYVGLGSDLTGAKPKNTGVKDTTNITGVGIDLW